MLTFTSPPLKEVRELAQRSMCIGGMLIKRVIKSNFINKPFLR